MKAYILNNLFLSYFFMSGHRGWVLGVRIWFGQKRPGSASVNLTKEHRSKSKIKALVMVFFDCQGILLIEWTPQDTLIMGETFVYTLCLLRVRIRKKWSDLWAENRWILHFDNTGSYWAFVVRDFLFKNRTTTEQPPYSPDLSPYNFFLFNIIKDSLHGCHLDRIEGIKVEMVRILYAIPSIDFQKCYDSWKNCMCWWIAAGRDLKGINATIGNYV